MVDLLLTFAVLVMQEHVQVGIQRYLHDDTLALHVFFGNPGEKSPELRLFVSPGCRICAEFLKSIEIVHEFP